MIKLSIYVSFYNKDAVSTIEKNSFPRKRPFQLESLYLSTSICRIVFNNISLKLSLLAVQNSLSFFRNYARTFFYCL